MPCAKKRKLLVFKSSLSMILSEMLSENWELDSGTSNCKAVELPKHFLDTAPWFLFHKVLCWKFFSLSIDFSIDPMLSLWQNLHQFCVGESHLSVSHCSDMQATILTCRFPQWKQVSAMWAHTGYWVKGHLHVHSREMCHWSILTPVYRHWNCQAGRGGLLLCEPLKRTQYSGSYPIGDTLFCYSVKKVQILQRQIFSIKILYFCYFLQESSGIFE